VYNVYVNKTDVYRVRHKKQPPKKTKFFRKLQGIYFRIFHQ